MLKVLIISLVFAVSSAASVTLLGDRKLISGDMTKLQWWITVLFSWRFVLAMIFALGARFSFTMMNNALLYVPALSRNATSVATLLTALAYVVIIISNSIFLNERISLQQIVGMGVIIGGVALVVK